MIIENEVFRLLATVSLSLDPDIAWAIRTQSKTLPFHAYIISLKADLPNQCLGKPKNYRLKKSPEWIA
jgi:hypothetical protein